jgi:hypothetical protein
MEPQPNYSGYCNLGMPPFWDHNSNHSNSFPQSYTPPPSYDFSTQSMGYGSSSGHSSQFGNFHVLFFLNVILIPYFIAVAQSYGMPSTSVQGMRESPSTAHEFPFSAPNISQSVHQRYQHQGMSTSVQGMRYLTPAPSPSPGHESPVSAPNIAQSVHQRYQHQGMSTSV